MVHRDHDPSVAIVRKYGSTSLDQLIEIVTLDMFEMKKNIAGFVPYH